MKLSLALVLVSISVLTAAKLNLREQGGNGTPSSVTPANGGTPAKSQTETTPAGSGSKTGSTTSKSSSGWVQNPSGSASFAARSGCQSPGKSCTRSHTIPWNSLSASPIACGQKVNGYSAAVNELAYGASSGTGGACGRCFKITPTSDPNTPSSTGPFGNSIVVKVNDLCTAATNNEFCDQTVSNPLNHYDMPMQYVDAIPLLFF